MHDFTAIDFETATSNRSSICQVGLVRVEGGTIVQELELLVQPPDNVYSYWNTEVHGLDSEDTERSPCFEQVWDQIRPYIEGQIIVTHNGSFDFSCLRKTLEYYHLEEPVYQGKCTMRLYKGKHESVKLSSLCRHYGIKLNHHEALSDARACAELYKLLLREGMVAG